MWLIVNLDTSMRAAGNLYEDSGDGFGYKEGDYLLTTYVAEEGINGLTVRVSRESGKRPRPPRKVIVSVFYSHALRTTVTGIDGERMTIRIPVRFRTIMPGDTRKQPSDQAGKTVGPTYEVPDGSPQRWNQQRMC